MNEKAAFIECLSREREDIVRVSAKVFNLGLFKKDLNHDPAQFIFEMLQNAEDADASRVLVDMDESKVVVSHDGRDFSKEDVEAVTTVGYSSKGGTEQIGKFGIGFKSVFALTDRPEIHSGGFHFAIEDLAVPRPISPEGGQGTLIVLPLKSSAPAIRGSVAERMRYLSECPEEALLFLANLRKIQLRWGEGGAVIRKSEKHFREREGLQAGVAMITVDESAETRFRVFRRGRTEVAYLSECDKNGAEKLVPERNLPVAVYFPTGSRPNLSFRMHVPYTPDAGRQSVNYGDEHNAFLTADAARLVADTLPALRDEGLLTAGFISEILPDVSELSRAPSLSSTDPARLRFAVAQAVKDKFASGEKLLPAVGGGHVAAAEAVLGLEDLHEILSEKDAREIWGRGKWIAPALRGNSLLRELKIPQVRLQDFAAKVAGDFFWNRNDEWLLRFYAALAKRPNPTALESLKTKSFVRLEDGKFAAPFDEHGRPQVYLPGGVSGRFPAVSGAFMDDELAKKFFRDELRLRAPTRGDEVKKFVASRYPVSAAPNVDDNTHLEDIAAIIKAMGEDSGGVLSALKGRPIVRARIGAGPFGFHKPEDCYFPNERTKDWFADMNIPFVEGALYDEHLGTEWRECFKRLGVAENIRLHNTSPFRVSHHGRHRYGQGGFNPDFDIHGLDFAVKHMSLARSKIAWEISVANCHMLRGGVWYSTRQTSLGQLEGMSSRAGRKLSAHSWLYDSDGRLIRKDKCGDFSLSDLACAGYPDCDSPRARIVADFVGLGTGEAENGGDEKAPGETGDEKPEKVLVPADELAELKRKAEMYDRLHEISSPGNEKPDLPPLDDVQIQPPRIVDSSPLRPRRTSDGKTSASGNDCDQPEVDLDDSAQDGGPLGDRAEKCAQRWLEEEFPGCDVVSGNEGGRSEGFDLKVIRPGQPDLFVEVKGRKDEKPSHVQITRAQWKKAWEEGENFWLVVVAGAEGKNPRPIVLKNPAGKFRAGELDAHPVGIRI